MAEVAPMTLDPAMNNAMVPNVMCNTNIMPEFAANRAAPQLISCMGNLEVARAFSVTNNPPPPEPPQGGEQAGQQPASIPPGFVYDAPSGKYWNPTTGQVL